MDQIWAITSYYNPSHYRRRLENFRRFRDALPVPLIVVELGYGNRFELCDGDADILVQIRGHSVLWQKERLLNVAVHYLPAQALHVAWLDCDIVFSESDWAVKAIEKLERYCLVQLFENLIDLDPTETHNTCGFEYTAKGLASFLEKGGPETKRFPPGSTKWYRPRHTGAAWAGHRSLVEKHGFYDAMILGGGDAAFALAAYGRFDEVPDRLKLNQARKIHYLNWARPFFDDVRGNVGYLNGDIFHYWHGALADRQYGERHKALLRFDFDPAVDIKIDNQGSFIWSSDKPELHNFVKNYFSLRNEDGSS